MTRRAAGRGAKGELAGKVALVTGGASGIGLACVKALRARGATVAVADFDRAGLSRLRRTLDPADLLLLDVADPVAVREAMGRLEVRHGGVDILVLSAGLCRDGVLWKMTDDMWSRVIDVDLSGPAHVLRAASPSLRERKEGRVVFISSINGRRGKFGQSNYAAAKAGLVGLARSAAKELASAGVTVNVVEPGFTETPMTAPLPDEVRAKSISETPLGRAASPEDIAAAVLFFVSPAARHVTGQVIAVDGGQALGA